MQLIVSVAPAAYMRLKKIAEETNRGIENLAAASIEESALNYFRDRHDDPAEEFRRQHAKD